MVHLHGLCLRADGVPNNLLYEAIKAGLNDDDCADVLANWAKIQIGLICFVALGPKSTAMVMAGQSIHLTTLSSWASLNKQLTSTSCTYFCL